MAGRPPPRRPQGPQSQEQPVAAGAPAGSLGMPGIDPTLNVKELVAFQVDSLQARMGLEVRRLNDLMAMQHSHQREVMALRAEFSKEQREQERDRLDAIRLVDTAQVQRAAEVQAVNATTLATAVATSAEQIRLQVAAAAIAQTEFVNKVIEPLAAGLAAVQRFQYEQGGARQQVVETRDVKGDRRLDLGTIISLVIAVLAIVAYVTTK